MATTKHTIDIVARDKTKKAIGGIQGQLQGLGKQFGSVTAAAKGFIAVLAVREVAQFTKQIVDAGAQFQVYRNQLRLITEGNEDLNRVFSLLQQTARENRTSFGETIDLFTKLRISTEALGFSEERVVNVTTKLSQALAVAGADGNTAASVIRQFGQAMASGEVRGDEFRSLVEGLGPALAVMARESGLNVGQLRKMSQAGELTAETMFKMFENSEALSKSFNNMKVTTGQLEVALGDAFVAALARFSEATGLGEAYDNTLKGLIRTLDRFAGTEGAPVNMDTIDIYNKAIDGALGYQDALDELEARLNLTKTDLFGVPILFESEEAKLLEEYIATLEKLLVRQKELDEATEKITSRFAEQNKKLDEQIGMDDEGKKKVKEIIDARKKQQRELERTIFLHKQYAALRVQGEERAAEAAEAALQKDIQVHKQAAHLMMMGKKNLQDTTKETPTLLKALQKVIGEGFDPMNEAVNVLAGGMSTFRDTASSALADVIMGTKTLGDALGTIVNSTLKALLQGFINLGITVFILEPLERFLRGQEATQRRINAQLRMELALRTALAFFGIGLPGRADGGPVTKNSAYVVGERGPELFIPRSSGNIISNKDSQAQLSTVGGGGPVTVNFNIVANDTRGFDELLMSRRATIQGIINGALHQRGKMGVV